MLTARCVALFAMLKTKTNNKEEDNEKDFNTGSRNISEAAD